MTGFFAALEARIAECGSALCIGLDPSPADLTEPTADAARAFCLHLIRTTTEFAAAFKPNAAFFEALGPDGWAALKDIIAAIPNEIPVILDAKRGDIASTAEAYALSAFHVLGADAITLNPYLGLDSLEPFLTQAEKGVFLLCKTSNPGARDLQDLSVIGRRAGQRLFERVAELAAQWNTSNNLGLVVGATHPEALARVRQIAPELWILAPGIGAQGGDLKAALHAGLRDDGLGLLVPVSRSIAKAPDPRRAAQQLAWRIRAESKAVARVRSRPAADLGGKTLSDSLAALADRLLEACCVKFGQFTLKSGLQSPIYLDLRQLVSDPTLLADVATAYRDILASLTFDRLAALPYAALPIGTATSLLTGWPLIYPRREAKGYGTGAEIEGFFREGETVAVIDDLATTGSSKFEAIEKLVAAGLEVKDLVVLIDRQSGAREALEEAGYRLHAVMTLTQMLDHWERTGRVAAEQLAAARGFLGSRSTVQDETGTTK